MLKSFFIIGFDGYGLGARPVDKAGNFMASVMFKTASYIPANTIRFALGVGTPDDIYRCYVMGWDMFDCVIPTREGRHGRLFIKKGNFQFPISNFQKNLKSQITNYESDFYETININNEKFKNDFSRVDENCDCEMCQKHSKAYMRYLFSQKESIAMRLASLHNLKFYADLMKDFKKYN